MSSAGQANEAGSVFRREAAVHFAVNALAGAQVGSLPHSSPVTRIDFETADATDDIRITHQDGTRFFVSAKRRAGLDKPTKTDRQLVIGGGGWWAWCPIGSGVSRW